LDEAETIFKKMLKQHPKDVRGLAGPPSYLSNNSEILICPISRYLNLSSCSSSCVGLGAVYVQMRKFPEARPLLEEAVAFDPAFSAAHYFLAERSFLASFLLASYS